MNKTSPAGRAAFDAARTLEAALPGFVGRSLQSYEEFQAAGELYSRVFGYDAPGFTLNPNLLCALSENGGSAVGVFAPSNELVGFAYGFAGKDRAGSSFHYSQSAVVDREYQSKGIGRHLKMLQREVAESQGDTTLRWSFDPILTRNAHFNFSTLGAVGIQLRREYYCRPGTDRIIVEWSTSPGGTDRTGTECAKYREMSSPEVGPALWGEPVRDGAAVWLPLPADPEKTRELGLQDQMSSALESLIDAGMVLVDCRRLDDDTAVYLAVRPMASNPAEQPTSGAKEPLP